MTRQVPSSALKELQIPFQAKLAAAWASLMFVVIYIDDLHLYKPGVRTHTGGHRARPQRDAARDPRGRWSDR